MTKLLVGVAAAALFFGLPPAFAADATMHGGDLHREGTEIRMKNFDVTLDGRLLTASRGVYHTDTGVVDVTGKVRLHFGPNARSFPGEVR